MMKRKPMGWKHALVVQIAAAWAASGLIAAPPTKDAHGPDSTVPKMLRLDYFSYLPGGEYRIEKQGDMLVGSAVLRWEKQEAVFRLVRVKPTPAQWADLRKAADAANVWKWHEEYVDREIYDGGGWDFEIRYGDKRMKSFGINAYPGPDGRMVSEGSDQDAPTYRQFTSAVNKIMPVPKFDVDMLSHAMGGVYPTMIFRPASCEEALAFLQYIINWEIARPPAPAPKHGKFVFVYRYDKAKRRPPMTCEKRNTMCATLFADVLEHFGLDYEVTGPLQIVITDKAAQ